MSKDHRTLRTVQYESHKIILYGISYERGYKFIRLVYRDGELWHQLDLKYLATLLPCPVRKKLDIPLNGSIHHLEALIDNMDTSLVGKLNRFFHSTRQ